MLTAIYEMLSNLGNLITSLVTGIADMFRYLVFAQTELQVLYTGIPSQIIGVFLAVMSLSVLFVIVGRVK